ncbi:carotenoid oxygenase family protein [Gordonia sp. CPCC 205333]|uniref:carotenoid oxygenase family protein n=1 Tax=Gordonia sp. CPCC 205333 TaxID=3140790 RepID=UPI003AF38D24
MVATTDPFARPAPVDIAHHAHLTGVFAPQREEIDVDGLEIRGKIPSDLNGAYLRNGPNPRFDPIGHYVYPLDGDGMVHRLTLRDGRAAYLNRYVRTPMVVEEERVGHAIWPGVTDLWTPEADEVGTALAGTTRDLPDINIVRHGGRLLAMAEAAPPYRLAPRDLATLGRETCDGAMAVGSTAHPKLDPETGELVLFNYLLEAPYLTWSVIGPDGRCTRPPTVVEGVARSVMIHDMALTSKYVVIFLCPLRFDIAAAMAGGSVLDWRPDDGTRIALIPRDGSPVIWIDTEPFWVWHFANAYDSAGSVVVDYVQWSYPAGFAKESAPPACGLVRATIDPATRTVTRDTRSTHSIEFPRIDDRLSTKRHRWVSTVGKVVEGPGPTTALRFFDLEAGAEHKVSAEGMIYGEPIYLPGAQDDYWGAFTTDLRDDSSWFVILPADDLDAGPVAEIKMPHRVPAGLHGAWLAE